MQPQSTPTSPPTPEDAAAQRSGAERRKRKESKETRKRKRMRMVRKKKRKGKRMTQGDRLAGEAREGC